MSAAHRLIPALTVAVIVGPVLVGLLGTVLPAFGVHPGLDGVGPGLDAWRDLMEAPGLATAVRLTVTTAFAATLLSLALAAGFCAAWHGSPWFARLRRLLPPLLAVPHAAFAIGFAFLVAPSGWLVRLVFPWGTGWTQPPDVALIQDPLGIALILALVCKEVPFLVLVIVAALGQTRADAMLAAARALGYGPVTAWLLVVLPPVYRQVRLPVLAVLAYSLSAVEPALLLAPTAPPPLTPLVLRWFADPDLALQFRAAAGAVLQLAIVAASIALWLAAERPVVAAGRWRIAAGRRGGPGRPVRLATGGAMTLAVAAVVGAMAVLAVWALAWTWRFPDALPDRWSTATLAAAWPELAVPAGHTLLVAGLATGLALVLAVGCLEGARRGRAAAPHRVLLMIHLPLLMPAVGFLFGVQVALVAGGLDGTLAAVVWVHLLYVLPYVFLTLADPWRSFDERYERTARGLGVGPLTVFVRVRLAMLLRPLLTAAAVGFAVSVGQYLPTLFAGGGRVATLTTEAMALAAGGDRRVVAVYAFAQGALPLVAFVLALAVPAVLHRNRKGMHAG
ncbi:ABC transporter permease [Azospirillum halopraeferens]|uniref:ABC transporter permease n=1 Tax=Azospirillum halopraeferens TaxID=34010 RepID=UPI00048BE300|nr:ABC transporter permease subunit [Azospirillum halopraeferens]